MGNNNEACQNEELTSIESTGFGQNSKGLFIAISIIGILVNIGFLFSSIFKTKRNGKSKISSLERLLIWLTLIEIGISIIWVIQTGKFNTTKIIKENCLGCKTLGLFSVFLYFSDLVILGLSVKQFKKIILNPLDAILKPEQKIKKYLAIAFIVAGIACLLALGGELTGLSVSVILYKI